MILPAVANVTLAELPGVIDPVANAWLSAVASCVTVSLFTQVTVVPTATVIGLGANAFDPMVAAPLTIETDVEGVGEGVGLGVGVGVGVGATGEELDPPPQATILSAANKMTDKR